jgi:hypothetical protein
MMSVRWTLAAAVIGAAALVGCGNDNSPPAGSTTPTPAPAAPTPSQAAEPAAAPTPAPAAPAAPAGPAAAAPTAAPAATPATPAATAPSAMEAAKTQADQLMTQAYDYVKNNKMDLADQAVTKLQEMKPNLPAEYGPRIDQLKAAVDAAKAAGGKLPGGFKMPGQ